jgi:hypothetical protein
MRVENPPMFTICMTIGSLVSFDKPTMNHNTRPETSSYYSR